MILVEETTVSPTPAPVVVASEDSHPSRSSVRSERDCECDVGKNKRLVILWLLIKVVWKRHLLSGENVMLFLLPLVEAFLLLV